MNEEHLSILKRGVPTWNEWRKNYPNIKPDLSHANLSKLSFKAANFSNADLGGTNFSKSILYEVDFHGSDMAACNLTEANLTLANLRGSILWGGKFCRTNVSDVHWDKNTKFKGIDVTSCYSNEIFKITAQNQ